MQALVKLPDAIQHFIMSFFFSLTERMLLYQVDHSSRARLIRIGWDLSSKYIWTTKLGTLIKNGYNISGAKVNLSIMEATIPNNILPILPSVGTLAVRNQHRAI